MDPFIQLESRRLTAGQAVLELAVLRALHGIGVWSGTCGWNKSVIRTAFHCEDGRAGLQVSLGKQRLRWMKRVSPFPVSRSSCSGWLNLYRTHMTRAFSLLRTGPEGLPQCASRWYSKAPISCPSSVPPVTGCGDRIISCRSYQI